MDKFDKNCISATKLEFNTPISTTISPRSFSAGCLYEMQVTPRKIRLTGLFSHTVFISGTSHKTLFANYSRKPEEIRKLLPRM
jgi:hypothetical protein